MSSDARLQVMYRIANATIRPYPYPHFYVTDIFPEGFYAELRALLPPAGAYQSLAETGRVSAGAYKERSVFFFEEENLARIEVARAAFWSGFRDWLLDHEFMNLLVAKFAPHIEARFEGHSGEVQLSTESCLVKDGAGYEIGPHTDAPHRLLSLLFYLPDDSRWRHCGTSLYLPKDRNFTCAGGPHYLAEPFECVATMPYEPNTLFGFMRTDNSFHGVEPVTDPAIERDLLFYDIRLEGTVTRDAPAELAS